MQRELRKSVNPKIRSIIQQSPTIPKCNSVEAFFTSKKQSRRKKYNEQMGQSKKWFFKSLNKLNISKRFNPESKEETISITPTNETSAIQNNIQFRKRQPKRKLNNVFQKKQIKKVPVTKFKGAKFQFSKKSFQKPLLPDSKSTPSLNDFILLKKVGAGSYSEAYLAVQKNIGFLCVLKILKKKSIIQNQLQLPLARELKIHHYLQHQNIIGIYGFFDDDDHVYLICQYANDGDLFRLMKQSLRKREQIEISLISDIVQQLCNAVFSLHVDYLMHRDIKPQNVFLSFGNVKLGDFGWSVYNVNKALRNTQCGTPLYLAPELVGNCEYSQAVDIWAIGVLTFELLTGQLPFEIHTARDMHKVISQEIYFDMISHDLARDFVQKMLERNVKKRVEIEDVLDHPFLKLNSTKFS